jgi:hypothetical protein
VVEAGRGRNDDGPGLGDRHQVPQVDQGERRLARHQDELPPLLEGHVRGALDEGPAGAGGDGRDGPHRAWADHHAVRPLRAGGRQRAAVTVRKARDRAPVSARGLAQRIQRIDAAFVAEEPHAVARGHEPHRHLVPGQHVEQAYPVRRSRGAGERHDHRVTSHRPLRLGVGERTGCRGAGGGGGRRGDLGGSATRRFPGGRGSGRCFIARADRSARWRTP